MSRALRAGISSLAALAAWAGAIEFDALGLRVELVPEAAAAEPDRSVRRFALLVGANDGGPEREQLLYASSDTAMLGKALAELGGVDRRDRVVLEDPSPAELERAFADMATALRQAQKAGDRIQFVFYYSGHSDETGLLLGGVHVDYKRLRAMIDAVPADVRIGILDSCSSGAFTRFKGGKKKKPFLAGAAADVAGHAYLTSSSADEAAQESDRIGGSFFTHYLVTGLRGAADFDNDRRVTLNEAYRFAFDETLARTETSAGGPQHAAYDIQLAGTGDLVMTDLRKTSAKLEIAAQVSGRIYVRDRRGNLSAELFKPRDAGELTLALEPGDYQITIDDGQRLHKAEVSVRKGKTSELEVDGLEDIPIEGTRLRGGPEPDRGEAPLPPPGGYTRVPFNIGAAPGAELNTAFRGRKIRNNFSVGLGATGAAGLDGVQAAVGAVWTTDYSRGVQAAVGATVAQGPAWGVQTAVGATWARSRMTGVQIAALNYAKDLRGMQLGAVSLAGEARGLQAGVVAYTEGKVDGAQIGLVTYADEADAAIALIPITKKGGLWLDLWSSDVALVHGALRFRARKTYSFLTLAVHPLGGEGSQSWSGGVGFGGPLIWRRRFSVELDNAVSAVNAGLAVSGAPYLLDTLRLSAAFRPARHFAIWGGVTANVLVDPLGRPDDFRPGYAWTTGSLESPQVGLRFWPGFALGFEF